MEINEITNLLTSVGFPVVMCLLMYRYVIEDSKQTREVIRSLETAIHTLEKGVEDLIKISEIRYENFGEERKK
jgi:hypothetical protein